MSKKSKKQEANTESKEEQKLAPAPAEYLALDECYARLDTPVEPYIIRVARVAHRWHLDTGLKLTLETYKAALKAVTEYDEKGCVKTHKPAFGRY